MNKDVIYIFAAKDNAGEFYGEHVVTDLDKQLDNLEYKDVHAGEYQIWKYPVGEIYNVTSDREVSSEDEYSVPNTNRGVIWKPLLEQVGLDPDFVSNEYQKLSIKS